jgi:uncharacterized protein (DUF58 family)
MIGRRSSAARWSGFRRSDGGTMMAARSTLVLAGAFVFCGAAFDSPSLYVPGVALAALVAGSRIWVELAARRARLEQLRGPWSIVEGEPYGLGIRIHSGRLPLPGGRVVHPLADRPLPVGMHPGSHARLELRSPRRGRQRLEPATLLLSDPMGLRTDEIRSEHGEEVLVLPRIEPVIRCEARGGPGDAALDGSDGLVGTGLDTRAIDFEIDGLRPYRNGSPASRIHWATVARTGEMVEHRLVAGADSSPLVVLDRFNPADQDSLDSAVRAAASICVHLAPAGGCTLLVSGERRRLEVDSQLRAWPQVHAHLAVVEAGGVAPAIQRLSQAETIFWVTAAEAGPGWTQGLARRGWYLVTPFPLPGLASTFTVAGCHGQHPAAARQARSVATAA